MVKKRVLNWIYGDLWRFMEIYWCLLVCYWCVIGVCCCFVGVF